jgi:hypothetical protein
MMPEIHYQPPCNIIQRKGSGMMGANNHSHGKTLEMGWGRRQELVAIPALPPYSIATTRADFRRGLFS